LQSTAIQCTPPKKCLALSFYAGAPAGIDRLTPTEVQILLRLPATNTLNLEEAFPATDLNTRRNEITPRKSSLFA